MILQKSLAGSWSWPMTAMAPPGGGSGRLGRVFPEEGTLLRPGECLQSFCCVYLQKKLNKKTQPKKKSYTGYNLRTRRARKRWHHDLCFNTSLDHSDNLWFLCLQPTHPPIPPFTPKHSISTLSFLSRNMNSSFFPPSSSPHTPETTQRQTGVHTNIYCICIHKIQNRITSETRRVVPTTCRLSGSVAGWRVWCVFPSSMQF